MNIKWQMREISPSDQDFLWEVLYIALWDAPDEPRRPRSVLDHPMVQKLVGEWGRPDDAGVIALDPETGEAVGALWCRLDGYDGIDGYGCDYPCLGIGVLETHQGCGVGSAMMEAFMGAVRERVPGLRLGVHPKNVHAIALYNKMGFTEYAIGAGDYVQMKYAFDHVA